MARLIRLLKENSQHTVGFAAAAFGISIATSHTFALGFYRRTFSHYKDGVEQRPNDDNIDLAQEVFDDIMLQPETEAGIRLFTVFGNDVYSRGSNHMNTGVIVGLPATFQYKTADDVIPDQDKILVNKQAIDWSTPIAKQLVDAMVLSDEAKKFAIAREVQAANYYHPYIHGAIYSFGVMTAYFVGFALNFKYKLDRIMKIWGRTSIYGSLTGLSLLISKELYDAYSLRRERKADRSACYMGIEYAQGGVEFYNKLLQRNIALRSLMGPSGEAFYTLYGNQKQTWFNPTTQLTKRRDEVVSHLQAMIERQKQLEEEKEEEARKEQENAKMDESQESKSNLAKS